MINVDTQAEFIFTKEYGIASVPTLKLFRNGEVMETLHDYQSEHDFDDNYAQQAMLRIFTLLGESHPLISKFRPNLSRYTH